MIFFFNYKKFSKATISDYIKNGKKIVLVGNKVYDFTTLNILVILMLSIIA